MGLHDDPNFEPPADIVGAEARAYEEKIVEMLREHLLPSPGPTRFLKSIELRGQRPETEIIFRYRAGSARELRGPRPAMEGRVAHQWRG